MICGNVPVGLGSRALATTRLSLRALNGKVSRCLKMRPVASVSIMRLAARLQARGQKFGSGTMNSRDRVSGPGHADYSAATE